MITSIIHIVQVWHRIRIGLCVVILITALGYTNVIAQNNSCAKIKNKQAIELYESALEVLRINQTEGYELLMQATAIEPKYVEAHYLLADIDYQKAQKAVRFMQSYSPEEVKLNINDLYDNAIKHFVKVIEHCPRYDDYAAYFYLGNCYSYLKDYPNAERYYATFIRNSKEHREQVNDADYALKRIKVFFDLRNNPVPFEPKSLKGGLCTADDEFLPLLSPDGEIMFYTRRFKKDLQYSNIQKTVEEFAYSQAIVCAECEVDSFAPGKPMPAPFNQGRLQGGVSVTIDNSHLFITICEFIRVDNTSYKNCDIYTSDFIDGEWSPLRNLGPNINGRESFEAQPSITADGKVLYFASVRESGYGKSDIYYSIKDDNGNWGKARNMGPVINTPGDDKTPFIHYDNSTLYFASDGHLGMGKLDIFIAKFDSVAGWTTPVNIGYPINNEDDEFGLIISADGKKMYFSSNQLDGMGGLDIYSAELYTEARPKKVLFVKGQITDNQGRTVTDAKVELRSVQTRKKTEGMVDRSTGKYAVAVEIKKDEEFILTAKKKGYVYSSVYINPNEKLFEIPKIVNLDVKPIGNGLVYELKDVNFASGSATLDMASKVYLDYLIEFLKENPTVYIDLQGHTDNIGNDESNRNLSNKRAKTVMNYLTETGITAERLSHQGFGESKPIATNNTPEGRALNRRTEFMITRK